VSSAYILKSDIRVFFPSGGGTARSLFNEPGHLGSSTRFHKLVASTVSRLAYHRDSGRTNSHLSQFASGLAKLACFVTTATGKEDSMSLFKT